MLTKGHPVFQKISDALDKMGFGGWSVTYENGDCYAMLWRVVDSEEHGKTICKVWNTILRKVTNTLLDYPMLTCAKVADKYDSLNPFTKEAVYIEVVPKEKAMMMEALGTDDPLLAAFCSFLDAGGELRLGNETITKLK